MIGVIVPVYKVEKYIAECIESILAQTYTDFELILIDDGSTDNSGLICDEYAETDDRIVVFHQENKGQAVARNVGLDYVFEKENSEWIAFVDSDDFIVNDYLLLLITAAQKNNVSISGCGYSESIGEYLLLKKANDPIVICSDEYYSRNAGIVLWGKLYKSALLERIRFPDVKKFEDEFVSYKLVFQNDIVSYIESPLYIYYQSKNSVMRNNSDKIDFSFITAFEEQERFFFENEYLLSLKRVSKFHINKIINILENKKELSLTSKKILKKSIRTCLRRYAKTCRYTMIKTPYYYYAAYPNCRFILKCIIKLLRIIKVKD